MIKDKIFVDVITNTKGSQSSLLKFAGIAGGAALAVTGLYKAGKDLVDAYKIQEQAEAKLGAAIKATGGAVGITKHEMLKMASALQGVTTYGDEAIIGAQGILTTFTKIGEETFPVALEAAMNMSTMFGQDLKQSSIMLGKALQDPITGIGALKRVGVVLTKAQEESIRTFAEQNDIVSAQAVILGELETQVGGVARAMADIATGSMKQLSNAFGDLKEIGGMVVSEALKPVSSWLTTIITDAVGAITELVNLKAALAGFGDITKIALQELYNVREQQKEAIETAIKVEAKFLKRAYEKDGLLSKMSKKERERINAINIEHTNQLHDDLAATDARIKALEGEKEVQDEVIKIETVAADEAKRVDDIRMSAAERLLELYEEGLTTSERKLAAIREELDALSEQKASLEKYSDAWETVEDLIIKRLEAEGAVLKEIEAEKQAIRDAELQAEQDKNNKLIEGHTAVVAYAFGLYKKFYGQKKELSEEGIAEWWQGIQDTLAKQQKAAEEERRIAEETTETKNEINRRYAINAMDEKDAELAKLVDFYAEEFALAEEVGADEVAIVEEYSRKKEEILEKYAEKTAEITEKEVFQMLNAWSDLLHSLEDLFSAFNDQYVDAVNNRYDQLSQAEQDYNAFLEQQAAERYANMTEEEQAEYDLRVAAAEAREKLEQERAIALAELEVKEAKFARVVALFDIAINTATAIMKFLGMGRPGLAVAAGIAGVVQAGAVVAAPLPTIPSFARGGEFTTSGDQMIQVGDNPGGRERVTVDPLSSPGYGNSDMIHVVINLDGRVVQDFVTRSIRNKKIIVDARSLINTGSIF